MIWNYGLNVYLKVETDIMWDFGWDYLWLLEFKVRLCFFVLTMILMYDCAGLYGFIVLNIDANVVVNGSIVNQ